jgi:sortase A
VGAAGFNREGGWVSRSGNIVLNILSLAVVGVGIVLIGTFFFPSAFLGSENETVGAESEDFNVPMIAGTATQEPENTRHGDRWKPSDKVENRTGKTVKKKPVYSPNDKTLTITIPAMSRIEGDVIPTGTGKEEDLFRDYAAVHLEGTGYPWEKGSNVYIAGHRMGYPGTESFLTFYDMNKLEDGDEIRIRDSNGRRYVYRVFEDFVVGPKAVQVTVPVVGKSVLTLQTCTLPNYSERLIVRAERVA